MKSRGRVVGGLRRWGFGARRVYRHNILSEDTLGHLCSSSRHYAAGDVVAVEVCEVFERVVVVGVVRGGSHAVSLFVPWFCVYSICEYCMRATRMKIVVLCWLSICNYVITTFDALGTTLAEMAIPYSSVCISSI